MSTELEVNVEQRRPGEVALGIFGGHPNGFAWVSAQAARQYAFRILGAARDSEDLAVSSPTERRPTDG